MYVADFENNLIFPKLSEVLKKFVKNNIQLLDRLCVTDDYSSSDQSELEDFTDGDSFELDGDDIYDIGVFDSNDQSESENYAPTYDNLESEYDSSSMIPDQPRKRPINIGREAPISLRVQEKARLKKLHN